jgi:hypothetical protein
MPFTYAPLMSDQGRARVRDAKSQSVDLTRLHFSLWPTNERARSKDREPSVKKSPVSDFIALDFEFDCRASDLADIRPISLSAVDARGHLRPPFHPLAKAGLEIDLGLPVFGLGLEPCDLAVNLSLDESPLHNNMTDCAILCCADRQLDPDVF